MTLDEKLKEIETGEEFGGVPSAGLDVYASRLLAALKKCREQRNEWITSTSHKEWSGKLIRRADAELLKILEGGE